MGGRLSGWSGRRGDKRSPVIGGDYGWRGRMATRIPLCAKIFSFVILLVVKANASVTTNGASRERRSKISKESEHQRDNRCNRQQDLDMKRIKIMLNRCRTICTTRRTLSFSASCGRILVARCGKSARTDDEHNQIIAGKFNLLAAVLFPSTMINLIIPECTDLTEGQIKPCQKISVHTFSGNSVNESRQVNRE